MKYCGCLSAKEFKLEGEYILLYLIVDLSK